MGGEEGESGGGVGTNAAVDGLPIGSVPGLMSTTVPKCSTAPALGRSRPQPGRELRLPRARTAAGAAMSRLAVKSVSRFWWGDQRGQRPIKPVASPWRHGRGNLPGKWRVGEKKERKKGGVPPVCGCRRPVLGAGGSENHKHKNPADIAPFASDITLGWFCCPPPPLPRQTVISDNRKVPLVMVNYKP